MQSWPNSGQSGSDDGHNSWQSNFAYAGQNAQFDPSQSWSQPGTEQATAFAHLNPQDASTSNFFDAPHQAGGFLAGNLHGTPSSQAGFHNGHASLPLNQQYSQPGQDMIDPAFSSMHAELYGHQPKANLAGDVGINHMAQVQNHPRAHSQAFTQHDFSFATQNEQPFDASVPYTQSQLLPQPSRQESHTPVQHFENLHGGFTQDHRFSRPPQQQTPVQHQQPYSQAQSFTAAINGQGDQYQVSNALNYQRPGQPYPAQSGYPSQKARGYSQPAQSTPVQQQQQQLTSQPLQHPSTLPSSHPTAGANSNPSNIQYGSSQQPIDVDSIAAVPQTIESMAKKRKRVAKGNLEAVASEQQPIQPVDFPPEAATRKAEDIDALPVPVPSEEEAQLISQFSKRSKPAQAKYPSIKGLPHLVYDGSIKLPAPKSYDKLSPLVALPSRSGRAMVPELGYDLPCEIQGKFTSQYRPSLDKGGLDERRDEAKSLLDSYDGSMKALGKRRPKYTEYPHAFKEQLKSDEASKNKAEKKAKKEMEDERAKPIRAATRPIDPVEATEWDVIGIVHIEPSVGRTNAVIAGRVQQAGEFFIKLRGEMNRAKLELDQAARDKAPEAELAELRNEAEQKKEAFYRAVDVTIEHADDGVLDNLGGHQKLVLTLVNAMISSIKAGDFSGKLPKALLELFTHFRMTKRIAETANFETVRKRFEDKGDDEVKELAREIAANIKKTIKAAEPETATGYTGTSAASRAKAGVKTGADGSSAKRGREDDSDSKTVKKIAVESGSGSLSKKLAQPKIQPQVVSKTVAPKAPVSSLLPGKSRPVPKPVSKADASGADSPASASADDKSKPDPKKPTAKPEPAKPAVSKPESKPPAPKTASAPSLGALSGIASLLDSINAPKSESPVSVSKETKGSETPEAPEERARRLRKEARRKLRVSWKPEGELVQVKIFQKDDEEDAGREMNMIRDAADDRSEGMVLKQRANVEEDDDDDDIPYQPWLGPVATDFSNLPNEVRSKNYVTRGGNVTFTTNEQQRIAEREQRELMAIYTDAADIPPTPKSPPPEMAAVKPEGKMGYLPKEGADFEEIQFRWRDMQQLGVDEAVRAAMRRLDAKQNPSNQLDSILGRLQGTAPSLAPSSKVASAAQGQQAYANVPLVVGSEAQEKVLAWLQSDKIASWSDPSSALGDTVRAYNYTDPTSRLMGNAVEGVVRELIGKSFPANAPPDWIKSDEERVREWWFAYNKEAAARQKKEEEARAKAEAEANAIHAAAAAAAASQAPGIPQEWAAYYAQQQAYAPYMALLQQMTGGQHQAVPQAPQPALQGQQSQIPDSQLQSILAAINQPQQAAQIQAASVTSYLNPNDPSYQQVMMLTQMAQGGQQPPPPPPPPSHGNERDWDRNDNNHGSQRDQYNNNSNNGNSNKDGGGGSGGGGKEGRKKKGMLPPHKPVNKALIGTKPCTFWQQGKCARGDKCTFRHD